MEGVKFQDKGSLFLIKMFHKILLAGIVSLVIGAFIGLFLAPSVPESNSIKGGGYIAVVFAIGAIILGFSLRLLKLGKQAQAIPVYLWVTTFVLSYASWVSGGLYSITIMSFPVLFLFAGLFAEIAVFLSIGIVLVGAMLLMGVESINGQSNNASEFLKAPEARLASYVCMTIASGYCGWIFSRDMKGAFAALNNKHQLLVESQQVVEKLAYTDSLTGLLNIVSAKLSYSEMLEKVDFNTERIFFYFIDLDNFKSVNDLFDHDAGDQLLIAISKRLERLTKQNILTCRLGGDEFLMFGRVEAEFDFDGLAQKALRAVSQPYSISGTEVERTASIGIALVSEAGLSFDEVRKKSDMAMYEAKESGKNRYHYYSEALHADYMRSLNVLAGLKDALSEGFLDLYFQPQINLANNQVSSAEALLRWNRGNPNNYTPSDFIPVVESTELIHEIGEWVLREACLACKKWHDQGHKICVAVNVSVLQITCLDFYDITKSALAESGLDAKFLELELTEHVLLTENTEACSRIKALKNLGITLAIDDFGTGYSNMDYLTRLKVDVLKLDRSFISKINVTNDSLVITTAIIEMANVLGMKVVAEGIEQNDQRDTLTRLGCSLGQGFLWSKALPMNEFMRFLERPLASIEFESVAESNARALNSMTFS